MDSHPFISICIPAYKNKDFLERLLISISIQTFKDFEVVISDDSPNDSLQTLISSYNSSFKINYYRNNKALGSPANWNNAIRLATGDWIKIMHDDDWFADEDSLEAFANAARKATNDFIFSGFVNVDLDRGKEKAFIINAVNLWMLKHNPLYLFRKNYIGHPSTTLIKNGKRLWFDERIKWVVDFEFYIREIKNVKKITVIGQALVKIGIGSEQITKQAFRNKEVEIPENLYLLDLLGRKALKNLFVYDYYWRLWRNLGIRDINQVTEYLNTTHLQTVQWPVKEMISFQKRVPLSLLNLGVASKMFMLSSWCCFLFTDKLIK